MQLRYAAMLLAIARPRARPCVCVITTLSSTMEAVRSSDSMSGGDEMHELVPSTSRLGGLLGTGGEPATLERERRMHWLAPLVVLLLVIDLAKIAAHNQFFPHAEGRSFLVPWASCFGPGGARVSDTDYSFCSQFLLDEYSVTHFSHGFVLWFWIFALPVRSLRNKHGRPASQWPCLGPLTNDAGFDWLGFYIAAILEILWEMFENSEAVISAFRQSGPNSANYLGDSSLNSLGDVCCCLLGYVMMEKIRNSKGLRYAFAVTVAWAIFGTIFLYLWICDSLLIIWINIARPDTVTCGHNDASGAGV